MWLNFHRQIHSFASGIVRSLHSGSFPPFVRALITRAPGSGILRIHSTGAVSTVSAPGVDSRPASFTAVTR
jgi:hypothetical protein